MEIERKEIRFYHSYPVECLCCGNVFYITVDKINELDERKRKLLKLYGLCSEACERLYLESEDSK